jgi:hypothetical protein
MPKRTKTVGDRFAGRSDLALMKSNDARDRIVGVARLVHGENWIAPMARSLGVARQTLVDWLTVEDRAKHVWSTIDEKLAEILDFHFKIFEVETAARVDAFADGRKLIGARTAPKEGKGRKS